MLGDQDTIVAQATAPGIRAALSIIRLSGKKSFKIIKNSFSKEVSSKEVGRFYFGNWQNQQETLDEVVLLTYPNGKGFTGEEAAEIICHGNPLIVSQIIESIIENGARMARPGEFSYRAVVNGKLALSQAEAVLELIHAKTPLKTKQALKSLKGDQKNNLEEIEQELTKILANIEAAIDFTTEDIEPVSMPEIVKKISCIEEIIDQQINLFSKYLKIQQGVRIVIAGLTNAGKSSLLNKLIGKEKSIVTPIAGTTRDVVGEQIYINNTLTTILDTAGIRQTDNEIEKIGINKTMEELDHADLVLYVIDSEKGLSFEDKEQIIKLKPQNTIICFNKSDLVTSLESTDVMDLSSFEKIYISCVKYDGHIDELNKLIDKKISLEFEAETQVLVLNQRQFMELKGAKEALLAAKSLIEEKISPDLVSFEVKTALIFIKNILHKELNDEVLDTVFKEFCIGK
ncbi:MAG: tRNA uridine-5-carboxymethylaminomethyl(34) synthesis GTPase MnmE [Oligoflexia bacterium]|nr:tRNA uridine-5-carboxymethylaminomethyl(34) synthesis GTPase MnmE [Oligoflexia bacterium]